MLMVIECDVTGCCGVWLDLRGGWRQLRNQEHNDLYFSPNSRRVIKLQRMRQAEHVARMGKCEMDANVQSGNKM